MDVNGYMVPSPLGEEPATHCTEDLTGPNTLMLERINASPTGNRTQYPIAPVPVTGLLWLVTPAIANKCTIQTGLKMFRLPLRFYGHNSVHSNCVDIPRSRLTSHYTE
jgi:hypothetical protein